MAKPKSQSPAAGMPPAPDMQPAPEGMPPIKETTGEGGKVMVEVPKETFMGLHQIIVQLAMAMDEMAVGIQATDAAETAPEVAPEAPMAPTVPGGAGAPPMGDEAFLADLAAQGSQRGMM